MNEQVNSDLQDIYNRIKVSWQLEDSRLLITGGNGFLGFYFSRFFIKYYNHLKLENLTVVDISDMDDLEDYKFKINNNHNIHLLKENVFMRSKNFPKLQNFDVIINLASFASPTVYRTKPIETAKASVLGLWNILDEYSRSIKSNSHFQIFSSSEIYGDPFKEFIPTNENYRGNVSTIGPRACYDESKRFTETLGYIYSKVENLNISIVRPFNNYGPGMKLKDGRLPADVLNCIINKKKLDIFSDGKPTRSFCYVTDAIVGYILALNKPGFNVYNIGNDSEEIKVLDFVERSAKVALNEFNRELNYNFRVSEDKEFLTDNPNRRFPDISKARDQLNYEPTISLETGISKWLHFLLH